MPTGLKVCKPTSIVVSGSGSSGSIRADGGVEFSTATTLSLNGVFSADYDNYIVSIKATSSGTTGKRLKLRSSGTDTSGADYVYQYLSANGTTVSGVRATGETSARGCAIYATQNTGEIMNIYGPFLSQPTAFRGVSASDLSSAAIQDYVTTHSLSTSYDGFSISTTANNITGLVTVYGFTQ